MGELCEWEMAIFELSERYTTDQFDPDESIGGHDLMTDVNRISRATENMMDRMGWNDWHDCD